MGNVIPVKNLKMDNIGLACLNLEIFYISLIALGRYINFIIEVLDLILITLIIENYRPNRLPITFVRVGVYITNTKNVKIVKLIYHLKII